MRLRYHHAIDSLVKGFMVLLILLAVSILWFAAYKAGECEGYADGTHDTLAGTVTTDGLTVKEILKLNVLVQMESSKTCNNCGLSYD